MDYHYESLDEHRFQKLSQALIVAENPGTQCLPVAQPDGGRDAYLFHHEPDQDGFIVFQVKFSRNPSGKTERDAILDLIKSEQEKIATLISQGATQYYLVTNISGTAHLSSGSIDKANELLTKKIKIPAYVWWRDDLNRRLDNAANIKWSYPEILKATDVLPILICKQFDEGKSRQATRAIKNYMATQYDADSDVKFKQVDLSRKLTDLFVDLPIGPKQSQVEQDQPRHHFHMSSTDDIDAYVNQLDFVDDFEEEAAPFPHSGLAGAFLLQMPLGTGVSRFVLEGAPGQGKSTVTQFLCQVNRLRLLGKDQALTKISTMHKNVPVRAPFRVDLRDYASWVSGRHPFSNSEESTAVSESQSRSLESFLAMQISEHSGGLKVTPSELFQFFISSHSVVVLDGFDEVAEIAMRQRIIKEICQAAERLDNHAKSMQIIVTSRPAAFANSPGFPEDSWIHLELKDLKVHNIDTYKEKWITTQNLNSKEGGLISSTLNEKLEQPHIRDLARNPMQLAILLHLIHVQGVALPEKRTILYEEYMKLFFNREAEKSIIVRDHRELLLSIHGVLAWVLHTQAEGGGFGNIKETDLLKRVRAYLEAEEHDPQLTKDLFSGTVERVGALVSRVQGMYEFEVQPLREYFVAHHLYKTAPYSPVGRERKGTRPDRFEALARSFFWTNVTRFFCGFYDVGELSSLVDGVIELSDQDGYKLINQPRRLAMMLLSDQVFSQEPRSMKRLIAFITKDPGFQRLIATAAPKLGRDMRLPAKAGGNILYNACGEKLDTEDNSFRRRALRMMMAENSDQAKLKSLWVSRFREGLMKCDPLQEAMDFGIVNSFSFDEIINLLAKNNAIFCIRWLMMKNDYEIIVRNPKLRKEVKQAFFDGKISPFNYRIFRVEPVSSLSVLIDFMQPEFLANWFSVSEDDTSYFTGIHRQLAQQYQTIPNDPLALFAQFSLDLLNRNIRDWQQNLDLWSELVDQGFGEMDGSYRMVQIAVIATASRANFNAGSWDDDGFASTKGLVRRLFFARHKGDDLLWWRSRLQEVRSEDLHLCLAILLSWGSSNVIAALQSDIVSMIESLSAHDRPQFQLLVNLISQAMQEDHVVIKKDWFKSTDRLSPYMALILLNRIDDIETGRQLSRDYFNDYSGDDPYIVRRAIWLELIESENFSINWNHVQRLSKRACQMGLRSAFPPSRSYPQQVPASVAKTVLSEPDNHCAELISICEQTIATTTAKSASRVFDLATSDGWFSSDN